MDTTPTVPVSETISPEVLAKQKHASWGAIIIIVLIVGMIVIGAFYAWGQRVSQTQPSTTETAQ